LDNLSTSAALNCTMILTLPKPGKSEVRWMRTDSGPGRKDFNPSDCAAVGAAVAKRSEVRVIVSETIRMDWKIRSEGRNMTVSNEVKVCGDPPGPRIPGGADTSLSKGAGEALPLGIKNVARMRLS
jgi:hypothetical protein